FRPASYSADGQTWSHLETAVLVAGRNGKKTFVVLGGLGAAAARRGGRAGRGGPPPRGGGVLPARGSGPRVLGAGPRRAAPHVFLVERFAPNRSAWYAQVHVRFVPGPRLDHPS